MRIECNHGSEDIIEDLYFSIKGHVAFILTNKYTSDADIIQLNELIHLKIRQLCNIIYITGKEEYLHEMILLSKINFSLLSPDEMHFLSSKLNIEEEDYCSDASLTFDMYG